MDIRNYIQSNFSVVGHRGLPHNYVENTLESFKNAFKFTDMVELDVHLSMDNQVYIIHDFNLKRLAGLDKDIEDMESGDIEKLSIRGQRIPKLSDLLSLYSNKYFLVELKTIHDDGHMVKNKLVEYTLNVIESLNMEGHVCIISFDPYAIRKAGGLNKNIMLGFDYDHHSEKYIGKVDCDDLKSLGISMYLPEFKEQYMEKFREMKNMGYFVFPWAVDDAGTGTHICKSGLNGYITNRVDVMPKTC
jgi:glycerophosphoryl diester phosphodiesterase